MKSGNISTGLSRIAGQQPFSLRLRVGLVASLVLVLALSVVGWSLAAANKRSTEAGLRDRMQSWAYLILAAAEPDPAGHIRVSDDLGDPRLSQPGSGIYGQLHGANEYWISPSTLGVQLPRLPLLPPGQETFAVPVTQEDGYVYQLGLSWQLENDEVVPLTVSILVASEEIERQVTEFQVGLWSALGLAGLILLLAQLLLVWLAYRPLRQIASDVAAVESGGKENLSGIYPAELDPLVRNLNKLLSTEKANQLRYRNALDSLAHSLKTPLAVIRSGLEHPDSDSDAAMKRAVADMNHLVGTRLQRAAGSTRRTMGIAINISTEVERLLRSLEKVYSHKMIKPHVNIPADLDFRGEQRDLLELLGNLLDNAFKYGRKAVRISARREKSATGPAMLCICVEDDGPGIAHDQWPLLIQRGVRGDERVEGHGLGLAIVLELLNAYGGTIDIGNSDLGGARIDLIIPAS
ncbi:MAG TPA: ATP-binding protein [Xanthomonadales bacterium]|nr:ATP-binding protein [Xanthomonadales bacterium]